MAIIKLRGVLVEILCGISSDYKAYTTREKREINQFLPHFQNALYGTMVASLIYYRKFIKSLTKIGYEINPYYPCISNKAIDES